MLIALYFFIVDVAVPQIGACAQALFEPIMVIVITLVGVVILLGVVGIRIADNLGSIVVGGIFRAIGYLCRTLIQVIVWIALNTFRMIPRVFNGSRRIFNQMGLNTLLSNILAFVVVIVFVAIII